jgi:alkylation response protein AidB-like acyl-CoA dehydrogenase
MDLRLSEEQTVLRETALAFLGEAFGPDRLRDAMGSPLGYDPALWQRIATELGWPSLHLPESVGGLGLGHVDLALLLEVTGETLLCAPLFSTVALAANTLLAVGGAEAERDRLAAIAEGRLTATLALAERAGRWDASGVETTATRDGDGWRLEGRKCWVVDGASAELLLVVARAPGSRGEAGLGVFAVAKETAGLECEAVPTMDATRRLAEIELRGVRVGPEGVVGEPEAAGPGLRRALDLAAIALAAEQLGGAQRCLDLAVAHACERRQFGRPIGSFQAIQHTCADMYVAVEAARSAVYHAACLADEGVDRSVDAAAVSSERAPDDLSTHAALCQAWCSEVYFQCAADCIQVHGGVGFTWEYDPHLHLKRARASESWLGEPAHHRERIAQAIGLQE